MLFSFINHDRKGDYLKKEISTNNRVLEQVY
jgi:hypothetical protein